MANAVLSIGVVLLGAIALWWAIRVEPHWASRDGQRFVARVQMLRSGDQPEGRWREVRARVTPHRTVLMRPRGLAAASARGEWRIVTVTVEQRRRRAIYLATSIHGTGRLVLRIPLSSRARPVLDALADGSGDDPTSAN